MKKKKIIISICLVLILLMSAFVTVQATSGDENNIFEQLKTLITGNTKRIETLEKDVDNLENEIDKLKGEITELQKPKEEEKETENADTNNNKTATNTTSKKTTANNTTKKTSTTTTANSQNKIDTLNKEIASVKKNIEELEKQDNKQTKDIETLKTELNNKSEELKNLINSSSSSSNNNTTITKADLAGTWKNGQHKFTFNTDGTMSWFHSGKILSSGISLGVHVYIDLYTTENYKYTLNGNIISMTGNTVESYTKIRVIDNKTEKEIDLKKASELFGTNLSTEEELINYLDTNTGGGSYFKDYMKKYTKTEKLDKTNTLRYDYSNGTLILSEGQAMTKTK